MPATTSKRLARRALALVVLAGLGRVEYRLLRIKRSRDITIRTHPGVKLEWIEKVLFADGLRVVKAETFDHQNDRVFELVVRGPARQFDIAKTELTDRDEVLNVMFD